MEECLGSLEGNGDGSEGSVSGGTVNGNGEGKKERKHFAAAFVDLSRFPETQVWVYSTLEDHSIFDPSSTGSSTGAATFGQKGQTGAGSGTATNGAEEAFGFGFGGFGGDVSGSHSLPEEEAKECDAYLLALLRRMKTIALQMPRELEDGSETRKKNWVEAREYLCMNSPSSQSQSQSQSQNGTTTTSNTTTAPGPKVMIGSLSEIHRHRLFLSPSLGYNIQMHKTANIPDDIDWEVCQKWLFRTEALGVASSTSPEKEKEKEALRLEAVMREEGLVWDRVKTKEDVKLVQSRTSIKRQEDTLLGVPSVAVRKRGEKGEKGEGGEDGKEGEEGKDGEDGKNGGEEDGEMGEMVAWGFMALDGTLMTLHVEVCLSLLSTFRTREGQEENRREGRRRLTRNKTKTGPIPRQGPSQSSSLQSHEGSHQRLRRRRVGSCRRFCGQCEESGGV